VTRKSDPLFSFWTIITTQYYGIIGNTIILEIIGTTADVFGLLFSLTMYILVEIVKGLGNPHEKV